MSPSGVIWASSLQVFLKAASPTGLLKLCRNSPWNKMHDCARQGTDAAKEVHVKLCVNGIKECPFSSLSPVSIGENDDLPGSCGYILPIHITCRHEISPRIRGFPRILTFLKKKKKKKKKKKYHHLELQCNETEQVIYIIPSKCCSKMH